MGNGTVLEQVCALIVDCEHKTAPAAALGHGFAYSIGTSDIRHGRIVVDQAKHVDRNTYEAWTQRAIPEPGDLILAREAPVGDVAMIRDGQRVCLGQRTVLIRAEPRKVWPRYLHYRLLGPEVQRWMEERAAGSTVPHLNVADVRQITLSELPPLPEQKAIAEVLGALDDKIEANRNVIAHIDSWVRAEVAHAQKDAAETVPLADLVERATNIVPPSRLDSDAAYVGLEHIPRSCIFLPNLGEASSVSSAKAMFERNDILFGKLRPYFKKVAVAPCAGICSTDVLVLRPKGDEVRAFVVGVCASDEFIEYATGGSEGTRMPRVSWEYLRRWPVSIPNGDALRNLEAQLAPTIELGIAFMSESRAIESLRDALLPKLLSGELRVRDAENLVEEAV